MKLLTYTNSNRLAVKVSETKIIDIEMALEIYPNEQIATDLMTLIQSGEQGIQILRKYVNTLDFTNDKYMIEQTTITNWGPAITRPRKIICVGLNYKRHADETKAKYPEIPIIFNKFDNALTGHLSDIAVPRTTERLDYEVELGIVIGKEGKFIAKENALDYVFGYCTTNDISARDIQKQSLQWMAGKTNDGFAPVGPYLVTKDEISNPNDLRLTTTVNGEERQDSNTADMIFNCESLIHYISKHMTLYPGDLIMTGTPEGVILGMPKEERVYLQPGDEVTVEVEGLGAMTNYFVEDQ